MPIALTRWVPRHFVGESPNEATPLTGSEALFPDADSDGKADTTDRCSDTPSGAEVDDAGCSRDQFCEAIPLRRFRDVLRCYASDWRNDDPLRGWSRDCRPDRSRRRCIAR